MRAFVRSDSLCVHALLGCGVCVKRGALTSIADVSFCDFLESQFGVGFVDVLDLGGPLEAGLRFAVQLLWGRGRLACVPQPAVPVKAAKTNAGEPNQHTTRSTLSMAACRPRRRLAGGVQAPPSSLPRRVLRKTGRDPTMTSAPWTSRPADLGHDTPPNACEERLTHAHE